MSITELFLLRVRNSLARLERKIAKQAAAKTRAALADSFYEKSEAAKEDGE